MDIVTLKSIYETQGLRNHNLELRNVFFAFLTLFFLVNDGSLMAQTTPEPNSGVKGKVDFSWDKVPRFLYITGSRKFSSEELDHIAENYTWITLAINFAWKDSDSYEDAIKLASAELKQRNPNIKILYYWNASRVIKYYEANDDFDPAWDLNTGRLGLNKNGKPIKLVNQSLPALNIAIPEARQWWISNAIKALDIPGVDGLWIDATARIYNKGPQQKLQSAGLWIYTEAALYEMYDEIYKSAQEKDKLLIGNFLREHDEFPNDKLWKYFDGSFVENHYAHVGEEISPEKYLNNILGVMSNVRDAVGRGKIVGINLGSQSEDPAYDPDIYSFDERQVTLKKHFEYHLVLYLILADQNVYFQYTDGFNRDNAVWQTDFSEYQHKLGAPVGALLRSGYLFQRNFEHASVRINVQSREAVINWFD